MCLFFMNKRYVYSDINNNTVRKAVFYGMQKRRIINLIQIF